MWSDVISFQFCGGLVNVNDRTTLFTGRKFSELFVPRTENTEEQYFICTQDWENYSFVIRLHQHLWLK